MNETETVVHRLLDRLEQAMRVARALAEGEHLGRMRGHYPKSFDGQGLHPFSAAIGEARGIAGVLAEHGVEVNVDPVWVQHVARGKAQERFVEEIAERGLEVFRERAHT
jgi:hypothetical protein